VSGSLLRNQKFILKAKIYILLTFVLKASLQYSKFSILIMKSGKNTLKSIKEKLRLIFFSYCPEHVQKM